MQLEPTLITVTLPPLSDASGKDITDEFKKAVQEYLDVAWMYSNSEIKDGKVFQVVTQFVPGHAKEEKSVDDLCVTDINDIKAKLLK